MCMEGDKDLRVWKATVCIEGDSVYRRRLCIEGDSVYRRQCV